MKVSNASKILFTMMLMYSPMSFSFGSNECRDAVHRLLSFDTSHANQIKRFAGAEIDGKELQFGFESEYRLEETGGLLKLYHPDENLINRHDWGNMSDDQRIQWMKDNLRTVFAHTREEGRLNLNPELRDEFPLLPHRLILDETGNIEIISKPTNTLEGMLFHFKKLNERAGTGSMQASVSIPKEQFFEGIAGEDSHKVAQRIVGMINFYQDFDAVQKMVEASRANKKSLAFTHQYLGPMTKLKRNLLEKVVEKMARGEALTDVEKERVRSWGNSFKYIGGTTFRPEILSDRIIFEVRDAHKNMNVLQDRLLRASFFLKEKNAEFIKTAGIHAFDSEASFDLLDDGVKEMLKTLFPPRQYAADWAHAPKVSMENYRNFAWPLRDWSGHVNLFYKSKQLSQKITAAQQEYKAELGRIMSAYNTHHQADQSKDLVLVALHKFVKNSSINDYFVAFERNSLIVDKKVASVIDGVEVNKIPVGPLYSNFLNNTMTGPMDQRVQHFMAKYADRVQLVNDVKFNVGESLRGKRQVLFLSTAGLNQEQVKALSDEYLRTFSHNAISFPLSPGSGHLYTRIGNKVYDNLHGLNEREFYFGVNKLETFIKLNDLEMQNMREYVANAQREFNGVIGGFAMNGTNGANTQGQIYDNLPLQAGQGHNCTSWLGCVKLDGQQRLLEMIGANPGMEIYTNPGWLTGWLNTRAPQDRVFTVYITDAPIADAVNNVVNTQEGKMNWIFSEH